jgi:hypothetical protein
MHRIEVDDDVYEHLERHVKGFEQPNDVLRRLLLKDASSARPQRARRSGRSGKLRQLIDAGLVSEGDVLFHERPRKGDRFEATVTASGWLSVNGELVQSPSPALGSLVGTQIDGWANWTHERSGKTLRKLRSELGQANSGAV